MRASSLTQSGAPPTADISVAGTWKLTLHGELKRAAKMVTRSFIRVEYAW